MTKLFSTKDSAFVDFNLLYVHFFQRFYNNSKDVELALRRIVNIYGLEGDDLRLICYLTHIYPSRFASRKMVDILELPDEDYAMEIISSLSSRNFIFRGHTTTDEPYIKLTDDAIDAFNAYDALKVFQPNDFIPELGSLVPAVVKETNWVQKFRNKIDSQPDSDFAKAWHSLKLDELDNAEAGVMCLALRNFINDFTKPFRGKEKLDSLIQKGLLICLEEGYVISPRVAEAFLHGHDEIVKYDDISGMANIIKNDEIVEKELFFSKESAEEIGYLHQMLSKDGFEHACSVLLRQKRNPAIQSLLWGGPGTGKTETVKQIALETGRDIFLFDVAKVTDKDWGATEKLYRKLFAAYRYIVAVKSLTPILLINEADQVLSKRLTCLSQAIDKAENVVSNILLQEFEDMHGILLATTNNAAILDEAFDRRFLFKTELQKPEAGARTKIWKSMIPELTDAEAAYLAEQFEMSGAQISNVATKRSLAELYFKGDRGVSYIEGLCAKELKVEEFNPKSNKIGF